MTEIQNAIQREIALAGAADLFRQIVKLDGKYRNPGASQEKDLYAQLNGFTQEDVQKKKSEGKDEKEEAEAWRLYHNLVDNGADPENLQRLKELCQGSEHVSNEIWGAVVDFIYYEKRQGVEVYQKGLKHIGVIVKEVFNSKNLDFEFMVEKVRSKTD
jgi:hypothetical protein